MGPDKNVNLGELCEFEFFYFSKTQPTLQYMYVFKSFSLRFGILESSYIYFEHKYVLKECWRTTAGKIVKDLEDRGILVMEVSSSRLRVVLPQQISATDVQHAFSKLLREYRTKMATSGKIWTWQSAAILLSKEKKRKDIYIYIYIYCK